MYHSRVSGAKAGRVLGMYHVQSLRAFNPSDEPVHYRPTYYARSKATCGAGTPQDAMGNQQISTRTRCRTENA